MTNPTDQSREFNWGPAIVSFTFGGAAAFMAYATFQLGQASDLTAGALAGALLFGVLTFFFAMGALIALFSALGLQQEKSALGMPEGSIRAFMALVLIMLFFLMSVFLYINVSRTSVDRIIGGISQDRKEQLVEDPNVIVIEASSRDIVVEDSDPEITETVWDVVTRSSRPQSEVAAEIARQLITMLGTLIVAISAFYFGANIAQRGNQPG